MQDLRWEVEYAEHVDYQLGALRRLVKFPGSGLLLAFHFKLT